MSERKQNQHVTESVARSVRTGVQMAPAAVFTEILDIFVYDFDDRGYAAVFALLTLLFTWGQNAYETHRESGLFLRDVPPTSSPVIDD